MSSTLCQEPIAVVGIGCRFPGGVETIDALWRVLEQGVDCISSIPQTRWDERRFYDPDPREAGKTRIREAGFLAQPLEEFDAQFFGLSPREAAVLDPRQWLTMVVAWEALEDAGIRPSTLVGSDTGVFVGVFLDDSTLHRMNPLGVADLDGHVSRASSQTMLAARLSHLFDLRGPSLALDTACSASMVATHLGCQSLWRGESSRVLVGGVNLILRPEPMIVLDKGGFLSPECRCRAFDHRAGGYVRGEGAAVVVLEPLSCALSAGRHIYALICASGSNQDGRTPGITVPNLASQVALLEEVCAQARVTPNEVRFVEAHGTGTPVGDPVELKALETVLARGRRDGDRCWVGSIKTNVGHLEAAAGIAGLIKACLCLDRRQVAPSIQFEELNPAINLTTDHIAVARERIALPASGRLHALVNSFGYGGSNAAVLLRSTEDSEIGHATEREERERRGVWMVPVTARSEEALRGLALRYATWLEERMETAVAEVARSVQATRDSLRHRAAFVASTSEELLDKLQRFGNNEAPSGVARGKAERTGRGLVFLYSGMAVQSWGMADELYRDDEAFRASIDECSELYRPYAGWPLAELFDPSSPRRRDTGDEIGVPIDRPELAQPANLAVQVALTRFFRAQGIEPAATVGHSVGEVSAAWAAGVISLEDAIRIIAARAELLQRLIGTGTMLSVRGDIEGWLPDLERPDLGVVVATRNAPRSCVLGGPRPGLERLAGELEERGATCRFLAVAIPYHHPTIAPLEAEFRERLDGVRTREPACPFFSTLSGERVGEIDDGAEHWWQNCARQVRLDRAVERMREDGYGAFLEIGPHPSVGPAVAEGFLEAGVRAKVFASLRRKQPERRALVLTLAELFTQGLWEPGAKPTNAPAPPPLRLPNYAWHRERYEFVPEATRRYLFGTNEHPLLQRRELALAPSWRSELRVSFLPYLCEHRVGSRVVFPGAGFLESSLAVARELGWTPAEVDDLRLLQMLDPIERPQLHITADRETGRIAFASAGPRDEASWSLHATARAVRGSAGMRTPRLDLGAIRARCPVDIAPGALYAAYERAGLTYGETFRSVRGLRVGHAEVVAELAVDSDETDGYLVHPALLDGAVQALFAATAPEPGSPPFVPVRFERVRLDAPVGARAFLWGTIVRRSSSVVVGRMVLATEDGEVHFEADQVRFQVLRPADLLAGAPRLYQGMWESADHLPAEEDATDRTSCDTGEDASGDAAESAARGALDAADAAERAEDADPDGTTVEGAPEASAIPARSWLLIGRPSAFRSALVEALKTHGQRCTAASFPDHDDDPLVDADNAGFPDAVVFLGAWEDAVTKTDGPPSVVSDVLAAFSVCRAIAAANRPPALLTIVTRNAYRVESRDEPVAPGERALWGLGRVLGNEVPAVSCRRADARMGTAVETATAVAEELLRETDEDEVALRAGGRYAHRFTTSRGADAGLPVWIPGDAPVRMEATAAGAGAAGLRFVETERATLGPDELECRVHLAGLNFKDILKAQNRLPDDYVERSFSKSWLGSEFVGRVERVGSEVRDFEPGDDVYGFARATIATYITRRLTVPYGGERVWAPAVFPIPAGREPPDCLGFVNFVTAWHCLKALAHLQPGETVLIHHAAGGVGLAAIQVARLCEARILATAGTAEKRSHLAALGIEQVTDSRDLRFADAVLDWTGGRGVDVVLGSATGEAVTRSLEVLAPFGRYVDIGKADIVRNASLAMKLLDGNRSFAAFDLDLGDAEPAIYASMREVAGAIGDGVLAPLPVCVFPAADAMEAIRYLGHGTHIGKVAVDMRADAIPALRATHGAGPAFAPEGTYLVVGGLGGLGLALASWLVDHGAQHLCLVGRSGAADAAAAEAVDALRTRTKVRVVAADATDRVATTGLLEDIRQHGPPLRGVFHLAAVWEDSLLSSQSRESFARVFEAKTRSALLLDELTREDPIEHFVLFSSISAIVGNPGQGAYAAANAFLDGLAHLRRTRGLPAQSINWGLILDAGVAARTPELIELLEHRGVQSLSVADALAMLEHLLRENPIQCSVSEFAWDRFARSGWRLSPRFAKHVASIQGEAASDAVRAAFERLMKAAPAQRERRAVELLVGFVSELIDLAPDRIDPDISLMDMGLDSLMAVELGMLLADMTGLQLRAEMVASGSSLRECAVALVSEIGAREDRDQSR